MKQSLLIAVLCPSFSKRERLVKWATTRLPPTWSSHLATLTGGISELWKDGSLLCTIINSAIPGACPNPHRHWRKPPSHAQEVAFKYLGVNPVSIYFLGPYDSYLSQNYTVNNTRILMQLLTSGLSSPYHYYSCSLLHSRYELRFCLSVYMQPCKLLDLF